jgi:hypothetical protein
MRVLTFLSFILILASTTHSFGQPVTDKSKFSLRGTILGKDTGVLILWYSTLPAPSIMLAKRSYGPIQTIGISTIPV